MLQYLEIILLVAVPLGLWLMVVIVRKINKNQE
jgi:hypothetical protein